MNCASGAPRATARRCRSPSNEAVLTPLPQPFPRATLLALSGCYFSLGVASLSVVGLLLPMSDGLGVSRGQLAFLVTAFALTYAVAAPLSQALAGDWDRRRLILIGLCAIAAGVVITGLAQSYEVAFAGRMIMAMGAALTGPMASALGAAIVAEADRGRALALVFAGMTLTAVLGVPLTAYLGAALGWRPTLFVIALAVLAVALVVVVRVPAGSRGARAPLSAILGVLIDRRLAPALSISVFQMAGIFATYSVIAAYLSQRYGADEALIPLALLAYGVGGVLGNVLAMRLTDRMGPGRLITVSLSVTGLALAGLQWGPLSFWFAFAMLGLWSVASMLLFAPQQTRLIGMRPDLANLLLALNGSGLYVGMAAGAALAGVLYEATGTDWLALASLALLALSLVGLRLSARP